MYPLTARPTRLQPALRQAMAFTLIELLVVIAIIAILAAILFPVFAQAREKARQSACLNNMKQMATGLITYTQDYDEMFPLATNEIGPNNGATAPTRLYDITWIAFTQPYIKNTAIFVCPSAKDIRQAKEPESTPNPDDAGPYTGSITSYTPARSGPIWDYGMTSRGIAYTGSDPYYFPSDYDPTVTALYDGVGGWSSGGVGTPKFSGMTKCDSLTQAQIARPSDMALVVETRTWDNGVLRSGAPEYLRPRHQRAAFVSTSVPPDGWGNTAFADGHVKALRPKMLYSVDTDASGAKFYHYFYARK